jgi:hypothetical protein
MREALPRAGAEQDDVHVESPEESEVFGAQPVEGIRAPGLDAVGQHHQALVAALAVDQHVAFAVAGEGVGGAGRGRVELHC